jgi:hypothetical protein
MAKNRRHRFDRQVAAASSQTKDMDCAISKSADLRFVAAKAWQVRADGFGGGHLISKRPQVILK